MATVQENIKKKLNDFMASSASKKSHTGILVEGFKRNEKSISFSYNNNVITIPIKEVLFPKKKVVAQEEYVDFNSKTIWVFFKASLLINLTDAKSNDCAPTCKAGITVPITTNPNDKLLELAIPTLYYDFSHDIRF
jgi:hypothetical protein